MHTTFNFHECLKRPFLLEKCFKVFLCFSDRPIGNLRRRSKETERSNYSPSGWVAAASSHTSARTTSSVGGQEEKKAINADLLFYIAALFSCGFLPTDVDQYNAKLEHLGDHCHTSIIPDRYLKIPIYFLDIFFREGDTLYYVCCSEAKNSFSPMQLLANLQKEKFLASYCRSF